MPLLLALLLLQDADALIRKLSAESIAVRDEAQRELEKLGVKAEAALRKALPTAEADAAGRIGELIEAIDWTHAEAALHKRAPDGEKVELKLLPGTRVFRWKSVGGCTIAFLEKDGSALEYSATRVVDGKEVPCEKECRAALLKKMKEKGVTVADEEQAAPVLRALVELDNWSHGSLKPRRPVTDLKVHKPYRGDASNNTYGGMYPWWHGDDAGIAIDKDGFVTELLGGHVR
jgi:hypothetical protein